MTRKRLHVIEVMRMVDWHRDYRGFDPTIVNMAEVRIPDKLLNDPRMLRLAENRNARLLYIEAFMWADHEASDGFIDDVVVPEVSRGLHGEQQRHEAIDALVSGGLWLRRECGYLIADWPKLGKPTRAERPAREQEISRARAEADRKGAEERDRRRRVEAEANSKQTDGKSYPDQANGQQPNQALDPDWIDAVVSE